MIKTTQKRIVASNTSTPWLNARNGYDCHGFFEIIITCMNGIPVTVGKEL